MSAPKQVATEAEGAAAAKSTAKKGYADKPMTLWEHLAELRRRLIVCIVALVICAAIGWQLRETLLAILVKPYVDAWYANGVPGEPMLHFQTPAAAFLAYFKLALVGGAAMSAPILFYELWAFVAPGLYAREKKLIIPFVLCSTALFIGGGYFGWKAAFPLAFRYLLGLGGDLSDLLVLQNIKLTVTPTVMMGDYIGFVTRMLLGFGLVFELPLLFFFLSVAGIINYLHLIRYGRWFVVAAFVVAAMMTPPDVTSQVMMAIPMLVLYGGSILLAYLFGKPPTLAQRNAHRRRRERARYDRRKDRERRKADKQARRAAAKGGGEG